MNVRHFDARQMDVIISAHATFRRVQSHLYFDECHFDAFYFIIFIEGHMIFMSTPQLRNVGKFR